MEYIFTYIANYGFPMVVASFLLFRMDKHLANLEEGIRHMNETLAKQTGQSLIKIKTEIFFMIDRINNFMKKIFFYAIINFDCIKLS